MFLQNPENLPVEKLTLSVTNAGVVREIKALVSNDLNNIVQHCLSGKSFGQEPNIYGICGLFWSHLTKSANTLVTPLV